MEIKKKIKPIGAGVIFIVTAILYLANTLLDMFEVYANLSLWGYGEYFNVFSIIFDSSFFLMLVTLAIYCLALHGKLAGKIIATVFIGLYIAAIICFDFINILRFLNYGNNIFNLVICCLEIALAITIILSLYIKHVSMSIVGTLLTAIHLSASLIYSAMYLTPYRLLVYGNLNYAIFIYLILPLVSIALIMLMWSHTKPGPVKYKTAKPHTISLEAQLFQLQQQYAGGLITAEEFTTLKSRLINKY